MSVLVVKIHASSWGWDNINIDGAGYQDLRTTAGAILHGELLGNSLVIYMEEAIYNCYHTSSSTAPFTFMCAVPHIGLLGPRLCVSTPVGHFFVGSDKQIYQYVGGRAIEAIGDKINTSFFDDLNMAVDGAYLIRNRGFAIHLADIHCVGFCIPTGSSTVPDTMYVYDYHSRQWYDTWEFAVDFFGYGIWEFDGATTAMVMPVFGDNFTGTCKTYKFDYNTANDISTAITSYITTQDVVVDLKNEYSICDIWYDCKGIAASSRVTPSVSLNGGSGAFTDATEQALAITWDSYHATFVGNTKYMARFKFTDDTASKNFELGKIRAEIKQTNKVT